MSRNCPGLFSLSYFEHQLLAACLHVAAQCGERWRMFAGGKGTLQARHRWSVRAHAIRYISLGQSCRVPRFKERIENFSLFTLDAGNLGAYTGAAHEFLHNLIMS